MPLDAAFDREPPPDAARDPFPSTRWSVICRAAAGGGNRRLEEDWQYLVDTYRLPIAGALRVRLKGSGSDLVAEAIEGFFGYLLEHRVLAKADLGRGQFRQFIQGVIRRYAASLERRRRPRRAAPASELETIAVPAEDDALAEKEHRAWTIGIVRETLRRLEQAGGSKSKAARALALATGIPAPGDPDAQLPKLAAKQIGEILHLEPRTVHNLLVQARKWFRQYLPAIVRDGAASSADYRQELNWLHRRLEAIAPELLEEPQA